MNARFYTLMIFVGFAVVLGGCGTKYPTTDLSGKASVDGVALEEGSITFAPTESGFGSGVREFFKPDGTYFAKNVPIGKVRVTIISEKKTGGTITYQGQNYDEKASVIPPSKRSGVLVDVTAGQKVLDFIWESDTETFHGPGQR